ISTPLLEKSDCCLIARQRLFKKRQPTGAVSLRFEAIKRDRSNRCGSIYVIAWLCFPNITGAEINNTFRSSEHHLVPIPYIGSYRNLPVGSGATLNIFPRTDFRKAFVLGVMSC